MRITRLATACSIAAALIVPMTRAVPATADSATSLGFMNFGSMLVDGARSQVIVSEGFGGTKIAFADYGGHITGTISGLSGPSGMVRVGTTLYVVERDSGEITPIDLTDHTVGTAIASSTDPWDMIGSANGRLWADGASGLDRINPATGAVTNLTGPEFPNAALPSDFATNPTDATQLAVLTWESGTGSTLRLYDVSTAPPTLVRSAVVSGAGDLRYSSDGTQLLVPGGSGADEFAVSDLSVTHHYSLGAGNGGFDATEVGGKVFVGGGSPGPAQAWIYEDQADEPISEVPLTQDGHSWTVLPRGARFAPLGDHLFAVVGGFDVSLFVIDDPTLPTSTTTLSVPDHVIFGDPVHLTGVVSYDDAASVPAGETVEIWRSIDKGAAELVGSTMTAAGGGWSFDQPTNEDLIGSTLRFHAVFPTDGTHRSSTSGTHATDVWKLQPAVDLRTSDGSIRVGDRVRLIVHLELDDTVSHQVHIRASYGTGSDQVATINVDQHGDGAVALKPLRNVEYWANSTADATHDSVQSNHERVKVHAEVTAALGGYYATKNGVRLYHPDANPTYTVHVEPRSRGRHVYVLLQKHTSHGWKDVADRYFRLGRGSTITLLINGASLARRVTYRIRSSFETSFSALGVSSWAYMRVT